MQRLGPNLGCFCSASRAQNQIHWQPRCSNFQGYIHVVRSGEMLKFYLVRSVGCSASPKSSRTRVLGALPPWPSLPCRMVHSGLCSSYYERVLKLVVHSAMMLVCRSTRSSAVPEESFMASTQALEWSTECKGRPGVTLHWQCMQFDANGRSGPSCLYQLTVTSPSK